MQSNFHTLLRQPDRKLLDWPRYVLPAIAIYIMLKTDAFFENIYAPYQDTLTPIGIQIGLVTISISSGALIYSIYRVFIYEYIRYAESTIFGLRSHQYAISVLKRLRRHNEALDRYYVEALISEYFRTKIAIGPDMIRMNSVIHGLFQFSIILFLYCGAKLVLNGDLSYAVYCALSLILFAFVFYYDARLAENRAALILYEAGGGKFEKYLQKTFQK